VVAALHRKLVLAAVLTGAVLAGCGGDDPAPDNQKAASKTTTTAPKSDDKTREKADDRRKSAPSEPVSSEDREKIVAVLAKMQAAINDGDADRLCADVYAFGDGATKSDCVQVFTRVLKQSEARAEITLRSVHRQGSRATVNVVNRSVSDSGSSRQSFGFVKRDDEWRVLFG
jgi:hypothetical protein